MTSLRQFFAMLFLATFSLAGPAFAQSGGKPAEAPPKAAAETAAKDKEGQKKIDEITDKQ